MAAWQVQKSTHVKERNVLPLTLWRARGSRRPGASRSAARHPAQLYAAPVSTALYALPRSVYSEYMVHSWSTASALVLLTAPTALGCTRDEECSLLGLCREGRCICDPPWRGPSCSTLAVGPTSPRGAYGVTPRVTSWGGLPILSNDDALYHLFVTEIVGAGCGLATWSTHSTVTHAVSSSATGPYTKRSTALWHQAHNPQPFRFGKNWYIAHIGSADNTSDAGPCNTTHGTEGVDSISVPVASTLHRAPHPDGPWVPVPHPPACNNPSPFLAPNGTLFMACTWKILSALRPEGPWTLVTEIETPCGRYGPRKCKPDERRWEECAQHTAP
eukprot:COSAG02_NODE_6531_length_3514_cov_2.254173_1_plen_330_part_00